MGGVALYGCEKLSPAGIVPQAEVLAAPTYTPAQQAWLNFVAKVCRGEQVDPTGQYVKDGTIVPAGAEVRTRPKLDAARDKYPFVLRADGTVVLLAKKGTSLRSMSGSTANTIDEPIETPDPSIPTSGPSGPPITSTFVSSVGLGGTGDIVDIKVASFSTNSVIYSTLNSNLNKGAGGSHLLYYFTRTPSRVIQGSEYHQPNKFPNLSTSDPLVAYESKTKHWFYQDPPAASPDFAPIWLAEGDVSITTSKEIDLNEGAGGEYVYSYQSKKPGVKGNASPFHEIGILSGNSGQIQPPAGWIKMGQDLNDSAGGDFIYFCYKP